MMQAKITVNVQNGNEIRINDAGGSTLGNLQLFKGGSGATLGTTAATVTSATTYVASQCEFAIQLIDIVQCEFRYIEAHSGVVRVR
jgi:hypothetical protein